MTKIPAEIESILVKVEKKQKPTTAEQEKVRTFLGTLTTGLVNPANTAKELNNPFPMEVDVSLHPPETIEQRVKRIMSVSARIAQSQGFETPEEADDFDVQDDFETPTPVSPFEMVDHFHTMTPEQPAVEEPPASSSATDEPSPPDPAVDPEPEPQPQT